MSTLPILALVTALANSTVPNNMSIVKKYELVASGSTSSFYKIGSLSSPNTIVNCDDGYFLYDLVIYKSNFTKSSNLYLVECQIAVTPGYVAHKNGSKQPNGHDYKEYSLKRGYFHISAEQYTTDGASGGIVMQKGAWPLSTTSQTTVTSSFSTNYSFSTAYEEGINIGVDSSITAKKKSSVGIVFSSNKTISSISSDPVVSAQYNPNNKKEMQWSFEVSNPDVAGKTTFWMTCYYLFEMNNIYSNCSENSFVLNINAKHQGQYVGFLWLWYDGWEFTNSHKLDCKL